MAKLLKGVRQRGTRRDACACERGARLPFCAVVLSTDRCTDNVITEVEQKIFLRRK